MNGLVVFDLDGTLLRGDTVCEVLARPLGRLPEMRRFETLTDVADVTEARREMLVWYRDHSVDELETYLRAAQWAPGAHEAVRQLQDAGILIGIASITWKFAVQWFAEQLHVQHILGTDISPAGDITHVWGRDKASWLRQLATSSGVTSDRIAAVGDSQGDTPMLKAATLRFLVGPIAIPDADPVVHLPGADLRMVAQRIIDTWTD